VGAGDDEGFGGEVIKKILPLPRMVTQTKPLFQRVPFQSVYNKSVSLILDMVVIKKQRMDNP
jgi:hypothetical protein